MSTRSGNTAKQGQKYQNTFKFKHNKNSLLTRKIRDTTPLDNLCKRCLDILEWKINYRKYKPLTAAAKCIKCEGRNIYKAYRQICDSCALSKKLCSKCMEPTEAYAKPSNRRNDPSKKNNVAPLEEIMKTLKVRHLRSVQRKLRDGEDLIYDDEKGIVNQENGEVVIDIKFIVGYDFSNSITDDKENNLDEEGYDEDDGDEDDDEKDEDVDDDEHKENEELIKTSKQESN